MPLRAREPKVTGERAELAFMHAAARRGFFVAKPMSDSLPYDVILDPTPYGKRRLRKSRRLLRVQVKCAATLRNFKRGTGTYYFSMVRSRGQAYRTAEFDFLACYVEPYDTWYIIPPHLSVRHYQITLNPHRKNSRAQFERFRERWDLLGPVQPKVSRRR